MNAIQETLDELASVLGLSKLAPNSRGVVLLQLGERDLLSMEYVEHEGETAVVLCLARPLQQHREGLLERALQLCGASSAAVRVGMADKGRLKTSARNGENLFADTLVLMVRFSERTFRLPQLMQRIQLLMDLHNRIAA